MKRMEAVRAHEKIFEEGNAIRNASRRESIGSNRSRDTALPRAGERGCNDRVPARLASDD